MTKTNRKYEISKLMSPCCRRVYSFQVNEVLNALLVYKWTSPTHLCLWPLSLSLKKGGFSMGANTILLLLQLRTLKTRREAPWLCYLCVLLFENNICQFQFTLYKHPLSHSNELVVNEQRIGEYIFSDFLTECVKPKPIQPTNEIYAI